MHHFRFIFPLRYTHEEIDQLLKIIESSNQILDIISSSNKSTLLSKSEGKDHKINLILRVTTKVVAILLRKDNNSRNRSKVGSSWIFFPEVSTEVLYFSIFFIYVL